MAGLQTLALACLWALQYLAMRGPSWPAVVSSQLAGNALAKVAPGGGAIGAALQYRMLVKAGLPANRAVAGLTAAACSSSRSSSRCRCSPCPRSCAAASAAPARADRHRPRRAGRAVRDRDRPDRLRPPARLGRPRRPARPQPAAPPLRAARAGCPSGCCASATRIVGTLGPRWKRALAATCGRWAFDYASLLAALAAVGSQPRPGLVLLAFCAAQVLAQIPITPGGLGFVEAGLTGTLDADRRPGGRGGASHLRLPAVLLLAPAPGRARRVRLARPTLLVIADRGVVRRPCPWQRRRETPQVRR